MDPPAAPNDADPWDWSTDMVIAHVCGSTSAYAQRFGAVPAARNLANCLRENDIAGQDLLRDVGRESLANDCGVKSLGKRRVVLDAIAALRRRSVKYGLWERDNVPAQLGNSGPPSSMVGGSVAPPATLGYHATPAPAIEPYIKEPARTPDHLKHFSPYGSMTNGLTPSVQPDVTLSHGFTNHELLPVDHDSITPSIEQAKPPISPLSSSNQNFLITNGDSMATTEPATGDEAITAQSSRHGEDKARKNEQLITDSTGKKRRKLQPSALQLTHPVESRSVSSRASVPGERRPEGLHMTDTSLPGYLGKSALPVDSLFYGETIIGQPTHQERLKKAEKDAISRHRPLSKSDDFGIDEKGSPVLSRTIFCLATESGAGPGRVQYVNDRMKHFLLSNDASAPTYFRSTRDQGPGIVPYPTRLLKHVEDRNPPSCTILKGGLLFREPRSEWRPEPQPGEDGIVALDAHVRDDPEGEFSRYDKYIAQGDDEDSADLISVAAYSDSEPDAKTAAEMAEEAAKQREKTASRMLSVEEAEEALTEAVQEMNVTWRAKYWDKLELGAHRLWKRAHEHSILEALRSAAEAEDAKLDARGKHLREELLQHEWRSTKELKEKSECLQQTVASLCRKKWELDVLARPEAPAQPPKNRPAPVPKAPKKKPVEDDVDEISTEEEEDFIDDSADMHPVNEVRRGSYAGVEAAPNHTSMPERSEEPSVQCAQEPPADEEMLPVNEEMPPIHVDEMTDGYEPQADTDGTATEEQSPETVQLVRDELMHDAPPPDSEEPMDWEQGRDSPVLPDMDEEMQDNGADLSKRSPRPYGPALADDDAERVVSEDSEDSLLTKNQQKSKKQAGSTGISDNDEEAVVSEDSQDSLLSRNQQKKSNRKSGEQYVDLTMSTDAAATDTPAAPGEEGDTESEDEGQMEQKLSHEATRKWPAPHQVLAIMELSSADANLLVEQGDRTRVLIWVVTRSAADSREAVASVMKGTASEVANVYVFNALEALPKHGQKLRQFKQKDSDGYMQLAIWFVIWHSCRLPMQGGGLRLSDVEGAVTAISNAEEFNVYYEGLSEIFWQLQDAENANSTKAKAGIKGFAFKARDASSSEPEEAGAFWSTSQSIKGKKKRGRLIKESQEGVELRVNAQKRAVERQRRSQALHKRLGPALNQDNATEPAIVNPAKADDEDFINIDPHIAGKIHSHQIRGVQFLWGEAVAAGEGCLLAHTMGLGKTMQCITLLVALAAAAHSDNERVSKQVPESFKTLHALILCPPALVENWQDELLMWTPPSSHIEVKNMRKITKDLPIEERIYELQEWSEHGGILLMSYSIFQALIHNNAKGRAQVPPLNKADHALALEILSHQPNLVIADEAHHFKDRASQLSKAVWHIQTKRRIALTGSPLSNHLKEYFCILNWVAENYLGDLSEFNYKFVKPITDGMWQESSRAQRRIALRKLTVLKKELGPKVSRADYSVIQRQMPDKTEFVIRLDLTDLQRRCYDMFINAIEATLVNRSQANLWACISLLTLLCAHPKCFQQKLEEPAKSKNRPRKDQSRETPDKDDQLLEEAEAILSQPTELDLDVVTQQKELLKACRNLTAVDQSRKMEILMDIIDFAGEAREKVLVFSERIAVLDYVEKELKRRNKAPMRLDGSQDTSRRQNLTKEFNEGAAKIMLISTRAGGTGLNLQAANRVVILDYHFNPMCEQQAIGRSYRIGQKKHVYVYRLVIGGSFEEALLNQGVFKTQLAGRVVDKKDIKPQAKRDFSQYLKPLEETPQEDLSKYKTEDPLILARILERQSQRAMIRSIQEMESFLVEEREELTLEEQMEAEREIQDNRLRRADPEAWKRQRAEEEEARRKRWEYVSAQTSAVPNPGFTPTLPSQAVPAEGNAQLLPSALLTSAAAKNAAPFPARKPPTLTNGKKVTQQSSAAPGHGADSALLPQAPPSNTSQPIRQRSPISAEVSEIVGSLVDSVSTAVPPAKIDRNNNVEQTEAQPRSSPILPPQATRQNEVETPHTADSAEVLKDILDQSFVSKPSSISPRIGLDDDLSQISQELREEGTTQLRDRIQAAIAEADHLPADLLIFSDQLVARTEKTVFRRSLSSSNYRAKLRQLLRELSSPNAVRDNLQKLANKDTDGSVSSNSPRGTPVSPTLRRAGSKRTSAPAGAELNSPATSSAAPGPSRNIPAPRRTPSEKAAIQQREHHQHEGPLSLDGPASPVLPDAPTRDSTRISRNPLRGASSDLAALSSESFSAQTPAFPDGPPKDIARGQDDTHDAPMNPLLPPRRGVQGSGRGGSSQGSGRGGSSQDPGRIGGSQDSGRGGSSQGSGRGGSSQASGRGASSQHSERGGSSQASGRGVGSQNSGRGGSSQSAGRGGSAPGARSGDSLTPQPGRPAQRPRSSTNRNDVSSSFFPHVSIRGSSSTSFRARGGGGRGGRGGRSTGYPSLDRLRQSESRRDDSGNNDHQKHADERGLMRPGREL